MIRLATVNGRDVMQTSRQEFPVIDRRSILHNTLGHGMRGFCQLVALFSLTPQISDFWISAGDAWHDRFCPPEPTP